MLQELSTKPNVTRAIPYSRIWNTTLWPDWLHFFVLLNEILKTKQYFQSIKESKYLVLQLIIYKQVLICKTYRPPPKSVRESRVRVFKYSQLIGRTLASSVSFTGNMRLLAEEELCELVLSSESISRCISEGSCVQNRHGERCPNDHACLNQFPAISLMKWIEDFRMHLWGLKHTKLWKARFYELIRNSVIIHDTGSVKSSFNSMVSIYVVPSLIDSRDVTSRTMCGAKIWEHVPMTHRVVMWSLL